MGSIYYTSRSLTFHAIYNNASNHGRQNGAHAHAAPRRQRRRLLGLPSSSLAGNDQHEEADRHPYATGASRAHIRAVREACGPLGPATRLRGLHMDFNLGSAAAPRVGHDAFLALTDRLIDTIATLGHPPEHLKGTIVARSYQPCDYVGLR